MLDHVKTAHFKSAAELLDGISPRGPIFGHLNSEDEWIFRGHAHEDYLLVPSSLRPENSAALHKLAGTDLDVGAKSDTRIAQSLAEIAILSKFAAELDRQGLPIPTEAFEISGLLKEFRHAWSDGKRRRTMPEWPKFEFIQLMGLAQHYGLPTRLLDWTRWAFIAAYFAVEPTRSHGSGGNASIWAMNTRGTDGLGLQCDPNEYPIRVVSVPRATNPNFHAQSGIFTIQMTGVPETSESAVLRTALDRVISKLDLAKLVVPHQFMHKFTFPRTIAGEVLHLLAKEGVTGARLFPGYQGAAAALQEQLLWRKTSRAGQASA